MNASDQQSAVSDQPGQFQGSHYCSATRSLRVDLGNVQRDDAILIMALLSLFTDPGCARMLAALKAGTHQLCLEGGHMHLKSPTETCAHQLN